MCVKYIRLVLSILNARETFACARKATAKRVYLPGVADESKAESVLSILSIFLVGYRFSFSLSFERTRASDVYKFLC